MNDCSDQLIGIFNEVLRLDPPARAAYLDRACGGGSGLRQGVQSLLDAHERAGGFLEEAVSFLRSDDGLQPSAGEGPGDRVGRYRLVKQIGEGGCGVVYLADQDEPVRRQVALKIVKPGMDTRRVIAQFESERQALAMMEHPHIAQVLDAGATAAGRPYFVMELVRGEKITDYCDQHALTLRARLELFVQVCHAIQHAHQKGIIHRDIKPSNILVSSTGEGEPLPKVIDFGIAKATTGQRLGDKTLFTAADMLVGTPTYMSPEQAAFGRPDADTRTDIYSLGVLLYELLCGTAPFEVQELLKGGLDEVRQAILNREPVRPSNRLKILPPAVLGKAARDRQAEPSRLIRAIRGDLDWIVMKALEKDRARRYATANALAMDVQRHLANEPVAARPPGTLYQVGKLVARNRLLVGSLSVIALLLVSSLAVVSVLLARERAAHAQAERDRFIANLEAQRQGQVSGVLRKMMAGLTPAVARRQDTTTLRELLARIDREIREDPAMRPEVQSLLRSLLGETYRELGDNVAAERMFRQSLDAAQKASPRDRRLIADVMTLLSRILIDRQEFEEAEQLLQSAGDWWRDLREEEGKGSIVTMEHLAILRSRQERHEEAEQLIQRVLAWREKNLKPDEPDLVNAMANRAVIAHGAGKFPEAERMFREVLAARQRQLGQDHEVLALLNMNLYWVISRQGREDEAKEYLSRAVAMYRKHFEPTHPARVQASSILADKQSDAGVLAEAELLYREVIANGDHSGEDRNQMFNGAIGSLVFILDGQNRVPEADAVFDQVLTPEFAATPKCERVLEMRVEYRARSGRWREAVADAVKLVAIAPQKHEHYHRLAPLLVAAGDEAAYRKLCVEILSRFAATTDAGTADRMAKDCLIRPGAVDDLEALGRMADLALRTGKIPSHLPYYRVCKALAEYRHGNFATAVEFAATGENLPPEVKAEALAVRAMALQRMNRLEEAEAALAEGSAVFEAKMPAPKSGNLVRGWQDWIIARELLEQARALVGEGAAR